ncbi:hypothetical protein [Nocardioides zeae]
MNVPRSPQSLAEAVAGGVYLEILEAQQREMVQEVSSVAGPAKAAMYRQIALISKELEQLRQVSTDRGGEHVDDPPLDEVFNLADI